MKFEKLFSPGMIGNCRVKNRIIMSPYNKNYNNRDGTISQRHIDYFVERAKGGVGLLLVGATYVSPESKGHPWEQGLHADYVIESYKKLTTAVHNYDAKIGVQLNHRGRLGTKVFSYLRTVAPSALEAESVIDVVDSKYEAPKELTIKEIKKIIESFGNAAERAKKAGFDVIAVHGAHGYLISQFFSAFSNKREDEYGGSAPGRERFALEIISAIRSAVGNDFPIIFRISGDEFIEGGFTLEDNIPYAKRLEKAGVSLIDVSGGRDIRNSYVGTPPMDVPMGIFVPYAETIKASVSIPVSVVGRINDPNLAEEILVNKQADFVTMARALNADPFFPNKAKEGREEDILACVGCLQGCCDRLNVELPITCSVNPRAGRERLFLPKKTLKKKKVLVIGGGPAGMEAARVSSLRGYEVILYEKENELGGQVRFLSKVPYSQDYEEIIRYFSRQIRNQGVKIELSKEATIPLIYKQSPDVVIVATGAEPFIPYLPGIEEKCVFTFLDILKATSFPQKRAVVIGGEVIGCQTSEFLAERGVQVILVEPHKELAVDGGQRVKVFALERIKNNPKIETHTNTAIKGIYSNSVIIEDGTYEKTLEDIDIVVIAMGTIANRTIANALFEDNEIPEVYYIGDCFEPRKTLDAIYEGAEVAYRI